MATKTPEKAYVDDIVRRGSMYLEANDFRKNRICRAEFEGAVTALYKAGIISIDKLWEYYALWDRYA